MELSAMHSRPSVHLKDQIILIISELRLVLYSLKHPAGLRDTGFSWEQDVADVKKELEHQLFTLVSYIAGQWSRYI